MIRFLIALGLFFSLPACALAQCNGVFPSGTVCGNPTGVPGIPGPLPLATFALAPGGSSGNVQTNNGSGGLAGLTNTQLTAIINPFTSVLAGVVPASGGSSTSLFLNQTGTFTAPPAFNAAAITPKSVNNICYIDGTGYTSLANALATCSSNSTIVIPSAQAISSNIAISGNGVLIKCENNATLTFSANISITFSGTDATMRDCNIVGQGTGVATAAPIKFNNQRFTFLHNTVSNFGTAAAGGIIQGISTGSNISGVLIEDNNINTTAEIGISLTGTGPALHLRINNNYVSNGIWIIPGIGGTFLHVSINNNILDAGSATLTGPACIQILGGNTNLINVSVNNNVCKATANMIVAGAECMGLAGIVIFSFNNNICDSQGFTWPIAFELNQMSNGSFIGNVTNTGGAASHGVYAENLNQVTIANNSIAGFGTANTDAGIDILTNTASLNQQQVTVTGNVIQLPNGGAGQGIAIRCAHAVFCTDYTVTGNTIISDGTAGSKGVWFNRTAGTFSTAIVTGNTIRGPATGIQADASVTDVCTSPNAAAASGSNMIQATTAVSIATAATNCH